MAVAEQVFMGGVMVTDSSGLPVEFRYTDPVRATKLQKVLYGDVLEKYIHGEVIAANLVSRLEQKPDTFLVGDYTLLSTMVAAGKKVAALMPTRIPPLAEYGMEQEGADSDFLLQLSTSGSPVRIRVAPGTEPARREEIAKALVGAGRTMDVLEPLARLESAIKMLWEESQATPSE